MQKLISIIIPTFKGSSTIINLLEQLKNKFKNLNFEIIVINDNSPDDTHVKLKEYYKNNNDFLTYLKLAKNFGEYNAVMAGLRNCKGDLAIIIDDDFQHSPDEVFRLAEYSLESKADVVFTKFTKKNHSFIRNIMSKISNFSANFVLNKPGDIYLSSFKSLKRNIIDIISKYDGNYVFIDGLILNCTTKIEDFEVSHEKRINGKSTYSLFKLANHYLNLLTNFSILPLRIFFIFGLLISSISFVFLIFIIIEKIINPAMPIGYSSLVGSIIFFSGIQILFLGFIGEYIGKILKLANKEHQYVIDSVFYNKNSQK
jgi:glycosyltransferase involved in cell wall biosynthesis